MPRKISNIQRNRGKYYPAVAILEYSLYASKWVLVLWSVNSSIAVLPRDIKNYYRGFCVPKLLQHTDLRLVLLCYVNRGLEMGRPRPKISTECR